MALERTCVICWETTPLDEIADADEGGKSVVCLRCAGDIEAVAKEWGEGSGAMWQIADEESK